MTAPPPAAWRVISENGALVREEADLKSRELGRVTTGAVLLQEAPVSLSSRLRFRLLRGTGPRAGFVSVKIKGKALLEECELETPTTHLPRVTMEVEMPGDGFTAWFPFRRVANFRDLADSTCGSPPPKRPLRRGRLFRSGHFAAAQPEDLAYLETFGLRTYVDLRDGLDLEGADAPIYERFPPSPRAQRDGAAADRSPGQPRRVWCPFSKDLKLRPWTNEEKANLVPEWDRKAWHSWWYQRLIRMNMEKKVDLNTASNLCALNRAILFVNADEVLKAMKVLTEEQNYPVVFGCVAGKDRTGLLACLILSALGLDQEAILTDYLKTNQASEHINACAQVGMALWWKQVEQEDPRRFKMMQKSGQVHPLQYDASWPGLRPGAAMDGDAASGAATASEHGAAVFPQTMAYTLEMLEEEGGALAYLDSIGFGAQDVAKLRELLLEPSEQPER
ncbi:unnamed protein product [Durusdinium trenchii]|uniref:Uncharacterized protein n=2 Tax=Durusdinium trenchii TaxID=1381693 RepID=A0ABP0SV77_9DINO